MHRVRLDATLYTSRDLKITVLQKQKKTRRKVHSVELQVHADVMKCISAMLLLYKASQKYTSTFSFVHGGEFFTGNYILWHPPHSVIVSDPQAINACSAFVHTKLELSFCIGSTDMKGVPKVGKWWPCSATDPWPPEPKINSLRQTVEDNYHAKYRVILIRGFPFIMLTYTPTCIHTHTHRDKVIAISVPPYYVVGVVNYAIRPVVHSNFTKMT